MSEPAQSRKLQTSGGSTYVVSLPKAWVEQMNMRAGHGVTMVKNGNNSITVYPDGRAADPERAATVVGPRDSPESIRRKIVSMYLAGYRYIVVTAGGIRLGPSQVSAIMRFARSSLIGTEIVESGPGHVTIQILTHLPELTFEIALRRMRMMTTDMHRESMEALRNGSPQYAEEVVRLDDEIDRFTFYMLRNLTMAVGNARVLHEMSLGGPADCMHYRTVISRIERIADHAALIAGRVRHMSGPLDGETVSRLAGLSDMAMDLFGRSVDALVRSDYAAAEEMFESVSRIERMQEEAAASVRDSAPNATVIKMVLESIRRSVEYTADIAEVVMDKNICNVMGAPPPRRRSGAPAADPRGAVPQ